ncbi:MULTISPECIES: DUF4394 domain-containing protein [unclassified Yoonia]|uniref:DUF4394 domain-containing protein n=1 Tax=unclassified Yoonia TaxID=2629118 RepID=UPI002AFDD47D|nr:MULTISPECIES: DUF4394 domain-containing protein [unclassified Yoonia]
MKKTLISATTLALLGAPVFADNHSPAVTGYALGADGTSLVTLPGLMETGETVTLSGILGAIAYRPVTGDLIGIAPNGAVYTIDTASGELTATENLIGENVGITEGAMVGFDFNNNIDAVRIVATDGSNHVYFPEGFGDNDERANSVLRFTDMFYAEGDDNAGMTPAVFASAYTNAIEGETASETLQYVLDAETNALANLANNEGTLTTVAALTLDGEAVDISAMGDLEIISPAEGENMAYAVLMMEGAETSGIYAVDLETGALTMQADLGAMGYNGFAAMLAD